MAVLTLMKAGAVQPLLQDINDKVALAGESANTAVEMRSQIEAALLEVRQAAVMQQYIVDLSAGAQSIERDESANLVRAMAGVASIFKQGSDLPLLPFHDYIINEYGVITLTQPVDADVRLFVEIPTKVSDNSELQYVLDNYRNVVASYVAAEANRAEAAALAAEASVSKLDDALVMFQHTVIGADGQTLLQEDDNGQQIICNNGKAIVSIHGTGILTPDTDYYVSPEGRITLAAPLREGDLVNVTTMPYVPLSDTQGIVSAMEIEVRKATDEADRAVAAAAIAEDVIGGPGALQALVETAEGWADLAQGAAAEAAVDAAAAANALIAPNVAAAVEARGGAEAALLATQGAVETAGVDAAAAANALIVPNVAAAEAARIAAQAAADAAVQAGNWRFVVATAADISAISGMVEGDKAFVEETDNVWEYTASVWVDRGPSPLKSKVKQVDFQASLDRIYNSDAPDQTVADAAARLALIGIPSGWKVLQSDNESIYRWNGSVWSNRGDAAQKRKKDKSDPEMGFVSSSGGRVIVDTLAQTVTISGRITAGKRSVLLSSPVVLSYAGVSGNVVASISLVNGAGALTQVNTLASSPNDHAVIGLLRVADGVFFGAGSYIRDGVLQGEFAAQSAELYAGAENITVNTAGKTIAISAARAVFSSGVSSALTDTVDYSAIGTTAITHYLYLNAASGTFGLAQAGGIPRGAPVFARFIPNQGRLFGLSGGYTRDGVQIGVPQEVGATGYTTGEYYAAARSVNVSTTENTITLVGGRVVTAQGKTFAPSGTHVMPITTETTTLILAFNSSGVPRLVPTSGGLSSLGAGDVVVGRYERSTQKLIGLPGGYLVNGADQSAPPPSVYTHLGFDITGLLNAPEMPSYTASAALPLASITTATIYGWYDALMAAHPEYITRTLLGNEPGDNLPIYEYRFAPPLPRVTSGAGVHHPKAYIQGGIHNERNSYVYPYHLMDLICNHWEDDPLLEAIRWGVEISVVPALSPWGIDHHSYTNSNDVNINRNYPDGWVFSDVPGQGSGPSPLSEIETQCSYNHMQAFAPQVMIDCHDFGDGLDNRLLWFPSVSTVFRNIARGHLAVMARKWKREFAWMPDADRIGDTNVSGTGGRAGRSAEALGILCGTHEAAQSVYWEPGRERGTSLSVRFAVESAGNLLLSLLRSACR
jgi:hypothetical protein